MTQKIDNPRLASFSVGYSTRPEFKLRRHSSSPLKWAEIVVELVFSPLERTCAMSQGFKPLAGKWVGAK